MTDKELRKLRREDLLRLLLSQSKEVLQLREGLQAETAKAAELTDTNERLKDRLNEKDEQIAHLKEKLNDKDALLEKLKGRLDGKDREIAALKEGSRLVLNADGTAGIRLQEIFAVAQAAAEAHVRELMGIVPETAPAEEGAPVEEETPEEEAPAEEGALVEEETPEEEALAEEGATAEKEAPAVSGITRDDPAQEPQKRSWMDRICGH